MPQAISIPRLMCALAVAATLAYAQADAPVDVRMRLAIPREKSSRLSPPAVLWLKPLRQTPQEPFLPQQRYTLLQKNRMFAPHLLVIPVGSVVQFPNADPFFHNVFSLFDGKRFDLGLYEAGSSKAVTFSHEGVSYIFCNIHPEMSAVVLTLSTRLYTVADSHGAFQLPGVPAGDYELHVWIEGVAQPILNQMVRQIHLTGGSGDLGELPVTSLQHGSKSHTNMYGQPYDKDVRPTY
jgi:hypothetical protein